MAGNKRKHVGDTREVGLLVRLDMAHFPTPLRVGLHFSRLHPESQDKGHRPRPVFR